MFHAKHLIIQNPLACLFLNLLIRKIEKEEIMVTILCCRNHLLPLENQIPIFTNKTIQIIEKNNPGKKFRLNIRSNPLLHIHM